jgi:hypothetical protein
VSRHSISTRVAISFATAAFALELVASAMYSAATRFSGGLSVEPATLLASGPTGAWLIHWGSLIDMFGYLSLVPVVLYLRDRYATAAYIEVFAVAGLALAVIGSIGAVSMATAAPPLITAYAAASASEKAALAPVFGTLYRMVVLGMWQTLETIPATVWLLGTALAARRQGPRSAFLIVLVLGIVTAAIAVYRVLSAA